MRHQERLTHLVLVDTTLDRRERGVDRRALAAGLPGIEEGWLRKLFEGRTDSDEEMRQMWELCSRSTSRARSIPRCRRRWPARTYFHYETHNYAFSVNNPSYDVRPRLGDIRVPTLVICGRNDWITPLSKSEEIAARIPGSRLEVFDRAATCRWSKNEKFISLLRSFLAKDGTGT